MALLLFCTDLLDKISSLSLTASHSLQAMQRSSPVGYLLKTCSPLKRVLICPFSKG